MSELLELAERCEAATGPDRELDMAICIELDTGRRVTGDGRWLGPDHFTASLDAAMKLVPEGWMTVDAYETEDNGWFWGLSKVPHRIDSRGSTAPLAVCIAALRALAQGQSR